MAALATCRRAILGQCAHQGGALLRQQTCITRAVSFPQVLRSPMVVRTLSTESGGFFSSVKNKITGKFEENQQEKAAEMYREQVVSMIQMEEFTLGDFRAQVSAAASEGGVTGWKSYMPGVGDQPMVKEMKKQIAIFDAMSEDELAGKVDLGRREKLRIAKNSGESVEAINELINAYNFAGSMHAWLRKRHVNNLPLPSTMEEARQMAVRDRRFLGAPGMAKQKKGIARRQGHRRGGGR